MEKIDPYNSTLNIDDSIDKQMEKIDSYNSTLNIDDSITKQMEKIDTYDINIDIDNSIIKTMTKETSNNFDINVPNQISLIDSEKIIPITGTVDYINTHYIKSFENLLDLWGTSSNDTHFINFASDNSGSQGDYNVDTYEGRYVFRSIGDIEVVSGSNNTVGEFDIDFNNHRNFYNREMLDKGRGYTYKSYISVGGNAEGPQDGRPMGKTAYYITSSIGDIIYPSNHWINFDDSFNNRLWGGTQNTDPGYLNGNEWEDYSSASFYSVNVSGDNILRVERGKLEKNEKGNLK